MGRSKVSKLALVMLSSTAALTFAASAHAQASPPGAGGSTVTAGETGEVVVTALKRKQQLLDTPVPVTALQPETLERINAVSFQDYLARVPGFADISGREGETQLILRGITTGPQPNTTVGIYVDDTPFGSSSVFTAAGVFTPDLDPADVQRIEVLRGPQGTLYGANTLGGLLKFVTTPPDPTGYHGRVELDGETVDHGGDGYGVHAMVNVPVIADTLAVRASVFDRDDPGYIQDPTLGRHDVNDTRVYGGRLSALWNVTSKLSVELTATLQNLKGFGSPSTDVDLTTLQPLYGKYIQQRYITELLDSRYRVYSADVRWDLGFATLTSSTSYNTLLNYHNGDDTVALGGLLSGAFGIPNFGVNEPESINQNRFTQEIRLASNPGTRLEWQVGVYYDHERGNQDQAYSPFDTLTGATIALPSLAAVTLRSRYTEYAGFGNLTYHFTPQFDIMGGVRFSGNTQHYTQGEGGILAGGPTSYDVAHSSDTSTTFLVTPEYKFDANNMVYLRIASGYRPGGPNALAPAALASNVPTSFQPDTLINYEVGYKASLFERRLSVDLSVFYIDWSDVQLLETVGQFVVEGNGGSAVSKGIEGALTWTPIHGLTFSDNFAYTDARLTTDAPTAGGVSGNRLPYVPMFSDNLNADYDWMLAPGWKAYVGASYRFIGDRPSQFAVSALPTFVRPRLPSYDVVDLRAGATYERYTVNLYVKNVRDSRGLTQLGGQNLDPGQNPYSASIIQPRTFGLSLSAQF